MTLLRINNKILVQERVKSDWPGITLPGGKVEDNESVLESVTREFKEETNLDIINPIFVDYIEWNNIDENRHLCMLYEANEYQGTLKDSNEGINYFIDIKDLDLNKYSSDFDIILKKYNI